MAVFESSLRRGCINLPLQVGGYPLDAIVAAAGV